MLRLGPIPNVGPPTPNVETPTWIRPPIPNHHHVPPPMTNAGDPTPNGGGVVGPTPNGGSLVGATGPSCGVTLAELGYLMKRGGQVYAMV